MNTTANDIKSILVADTSLGLTFATNLFVNREPASPDNAVTIFDTPGAPARVTMDRQSYEYPSIQIRVRNNKQSEATRISNAIYLSLHGRAHETWNGTVYESIVGSGSGPFLLDWDDNDRCRFVINFNVQRKVV